MFSGFVMVGNGEENCKGLPALELVEEPATAADAARKQLAMAQAEFIKDIAPGGEEARERVVEFDVQRQMEKLDGVKIVTTRAQVPFSGLAPIPGFPVKDAYIEFQMDVSAAESDKGKDA
jgi:hypothetical protein